MGLSMPPAAILDRPRLQLGFELLIWSYPLKLFDFADTPNRMFAVFASVQVFFVCLSKTRGLCPMRRPVILFAFFSRQFGECRFSLALDVLTPAQILQYARF